MWSLLGKARKLEATRSSDSAAAPAEVTQLALAPGGDQLAAGYADGSVRVWNLATYDCTVTFSGHKVRCTAGVRDAPTAALYASYGSPCHSVRQRRQPVERS